MPGHAFRTAVEGGDLDVAVALLADDVVFRSPAVFRPYQGRDPVETILRTVFGVFEDFRYTDELAGAGEPQVTVRAPRFELLRATTGRRTAEEIASYDWDPAPDVTLLIAAPFFTIRADSLAE